MAEGHPSSCSHATIGSVCLCDCSGVRHSTAINGGVPAPASAKKGAKGTPTAGYLPKPVVPTDPNVTAADQPGTVAPADPNVTAEPEPARAEPAAEPQTASPTTAPPEPPAPTFDERAAAARTGAEARQAAPVSAPRGDDLTDAERAGLDAYLDEYYRPINHVLRGGDPAEVPRWYTTQGQVRDWTAGIDEAMARSPLSEETQTWRGVQSGPVIFGDSFDGDLTGAEWTEDAYVSTSSDRAVSEGFANDAEDPDGRVLMRVVTPAGVGAVELSDESYESELLLQRGLRMRVVADRGRDANGMRLLDVEVIPT